MSKLYSKYLSLKKIDSEKIYLFKNGIFYLCLQEDAQQLSKVFGFKITNFSENVVKVGFPQSKLEYYTSYLNNLNIKFEVIDPNYKIENYSDYLNNEKLKDVINSILELDFNSITFKDAFDRLYDIQTKLKNIF